MSKKIMSPSGFYGNYNNVSPKGLSFGMRKKKVEKKKKNKPTPQGKE